jgi:plasmid maintenance system antidote protein VapI
MISCRINGRLGASRDMAIRLANVFGSRPYVWLQFAYGLLMRLSLLRTSTILRLR